MLEREDSYQEQVPSREASVRNAVKNKLIAFSENGLEHWQGYFLQQAQISAESEMPEHRNNYQLGLKGWLNNTYLQLESLMGEQFSQLVDHYIDTVSLDAANMDGFEEGFLSILKEKAPGYYDVGVVDFLINQSYYAADGTAFPFEAMGLLTEQQQSNLQFCMASFVSSLESWLQLDDIWHAYRQADLDLARELVGQTESTPHRFLISRCEYRPEVRRLSRAQAALFDAIQAGVKLSDIPDDAQEIVPHWIQEGLITRFKVSPV